MTMPDDLSRPSDPFDATTNERPIDTSDIPQTRPGTVFGPASDIFARARARARRQVSVTLRLDPEVLERIQAAGPDWQAKANAAPRRAFPE